MIVEVCTRSSEKQNERNPSSHRMLAYLSLSLSSSRWLSLGNQETASGVVVACSLHWYRLRERLQAQQNKNHDTLLICAAMVA